MKLGICYTVISVENKMLLDAAAKQGVQLARIVDGEAVLAITDGLQKEYDAVLQRSVSYSRSLYLTYCWERSGTQVINSYRAASLCGDKAKTSLELAKAGIPTPKTAVAFAPESAKAAAKKMGFPIVLKPVMGSWARMVHRLNDFDALEAAIDAREEMGNVWQKIYYLQEHIDKPGRDIRAVVIGEQVVSAIYRNATEKSGWITNTSRGGTSSQCPITDELRELCLKSAKLCGEGIYGVDLMESGSGMMVHEINHTIEFRNSAPDHHVDIPAEIVRYAAKRAKQ